MRLHASRLSLDVLSGMLQTLTGEEAGELPESAYPLYNHTSKEAFASRMSWFDRWGLLPEDHEGPRDNPFLVVPVLEGPMGVTPQTTTTEGGDDSSPQVA